MPFWELCGLGEFAVRERREILTCGRQASPASRVQDYGLESEALGAASSKAPTLSVSGNCKSVLQRLRPIPTKIMQQRQNQRQRLPGSIKLNRPLQNANSRAKRAGETPTLQIQN